MSHERASEKAARAFLRTVVVVDDQPAVGKREVIREVKPPSGAGRPRAGKSEPVGDVAVVPDIVVNDDDEDDEAHVLHSEELQQAFADEGLVCSVLAGDKPENVEERQEWKSRVRRVGQNADVLVLDWSWHGDRGAFCTELISHLLETSRSRRRQLVVIYTGENDEDVFARRLEELEPDVDDGGFNFIWDDAGVQVRVVQKGGAQGKAFYPSSKVAEKDLPGRIFSLFGEFAGGLLGNAAMHALGGVRDCSHHLLQRFRRDLDTPYIVHRAYTAPREGAEDQVARLLVDSVSDVVTGLNIAQHVDDAAVKRWFDRDPDINARVQAIDFFGDTEVFVDGFAGRIPRPSDEEPKVPAYATQMEDATRHIADCSRRDAKTAQKEFASFLYCAEEHDFGVEQRPRLANGTIVRSGGGGYLLCVMPLCDAERVPQEGLQFPFLTVGPGWKPHMKHFVAPLGGAPRVWNVVPKITNLVMIEFAPEAGTQPVRAKSDGEDLIFTDNEENDYTYAARLRPLIAHDISQSLGVSAGRIGMMVSEYVRRRSGG